MELLLLTSDPNPEAVLPALALLAHSVRPAPTEVSSLLEASSADVALVDARTDLAAARGLWSIARKHRIRSTCGRRPRRRRTRCRQRRLGVGRHPASRYRSG